MFVDCIDQCKIDDIDLNSLPISSLHAHASDQIQLCDTQLFGWRIQSHVYNQPKLVWSMSKNRESRSDRLGYHRIEIWLTASCAITERNIQLEYSLSMIMTFSNTVCDSAIWYHHSSQFIYIYF